MPLTQPVHHDTPGSTLPVVKSQILDDSSLPASHVGCLNTAVVPNNVALPACRSQPTTESCIALKSIAGGSSYQVDGGNFL